MDYYVVKGDNCSALDRLYVVKASSEEEALAEVISKYIDDINKYHRKVNQEFQDSEHTDEILVPVYDKSDLVVYTLDNYIKKCGKGTSVEIYLA